MTLIFSRTSPSPEGNVIVGAAGAGFGGGAGAGVGACGGACVFACSTYERMSCLVTLPALPVPSISAMSTPCSSAILRTTGVDLVRRLSSASSSRGIPALGVAGGAGAAGAGGAASAGAAGVSVFAGAGGAAFASPLSPILATTVLISTVSPSSTTISRRMPAAGAGISASTLSVDISKRGSSRSIRSPTCLSHLVMVPSATLSPIWGMITSVLISPSFFVDPCGLSV